MSLSKSKTVRYLVVVALINCLAIILAAFLTSYSIRSFNSSSLEEIKDISSDASLDKGKLFFAQSASVNFENNEKCAAYISNFFSSDTSVLSAVIFSRTPDENFFKTVKILKFNGGRNVPFSEKSEVSEGSEENLLKKGVYEVITDNKISGDETSKWISIYGPVKIKGRETSVQISFSADIVDRAFINQKKESERYAKIIFIILMSSSVIILILILFQVYHTVRFTEELTVVVKNAVKGETDISINPDYDSDISELATSFNSLVEEIKEKEKKISQLELKDTLPDLFRSGVEFLKENRLDDATAVFKTVLLFKGEGFGSYFNLGVINARQKKYSESLQMFQKALELNPKHELTTAYISKVSKYS